jgi:simple sugar transport system permease protein
MIEFDLAVILAGVIAGAAPIVMAALGETLSEKAGIVNLSLDGTILLAAMAAFVAALTTGSLPAGFAVGAAVGAAVAAVVALFGIYLGQNQVAVGFVLTLMARDLAYFVGNPYARQPGPHTGPFPIPFLDQIPFAGRAVFSHHLPVYASMLLVAACWWYIYRTAPGLTLQAVGENPGAAYARGVAPRSVRCMYTIGGGALVGLAGATFSLCTKPGWGRPQGAEGTGWIALALVIFGGWHPVKAALGAYVFSSLQVIGIYLQGWFPSVPAQVFQVAPFPLMIFTLALMSLTRSGTIRKWTKGKKTVRRLLGAFAGMSPAALGKPYRPG